MYIAYIDDKKSDEFFWFCAETPAEAERMVASKMILQPTSNYVLFPEDYLLYISEREVIDPCDLNMVDPETFVATRFTTIKDEYFVPFMKLHGDNHEED
nr:MAG: hypothetical protein [Microvirus sp.]